MGLFIGLLSVDHFESQKKISSFENTGFLNKITKAFVEIYSTFKWTNFGEAYTLTFKKHNFLEGEVGAFVGLI